MVSESNKTGWRKTRCQCVDMPKPETGRKVNNAVMHAEVSTLINL